ncbi:MAG: transglycosylase SLT domain-containing protein [Granulosicoccus sp.]
MLITLTVTISAMGVPRTLLAKEITPGDVPLPALLNTPEGDRIMLREISDRHVFNHSHTRKAPADPRKKPVDNPASPSAETVWEFVQQSRRLQLPEHERITYYREQYRKEALWIGRILRRATPFAGHVVEELDKRYLPVELALLPVIESGYRPDVHSPQDAVGIWQIVPRTAKDIGLSSSLWFDGRSDIRHSTSAAIDYLSYLNAEFHGDWLLTLAAYNAGLGRVRNAIKKNADKQLPTDFWSLKLPTETRNYVPKFLALVALLRFDRPRELELATIPRGSAFDLIDARRRVSLDRLSDLTGLPEKRLALLNAGLIHGITPPDGPHLLYVPQGYGKPLIEKMINQGPKRLYTLPDTHVVVAGDNLSYLAKHYDIPLQRLMEINSLASPLIKIGQKLTVMDLRDEDEKVTYVVTIGDTLSDIAHKFQVSVADIRDENDQPLTNDVIHPGDTLSFQSRHSHAREQ